MDLYKSSLSRFNVGNGRADAVPQPVVAEEYAGELYRGVKIRAFTANNVSIYVGSSGVSASDGFELPAGQEVEVEIDNASNVYVVSSPAGNSQQSVTLSGVATGDTFTLSFNGQTTAPIAENALASAVQAALVAAAGANFTVTGSAGGPYTVAFSGGLAGQDVPLLVAVGIGVNEQETLVLASPVAGDQMVLTLGTVSAAPVPYNASVAQVQAAMDSICGAGNSSVAAGTSSGWVVTFIGGAGRQRGGRRFGRLLSEREADGQPGFQRHGRHLHAELQWADHDGNRLQRHGTPGPSGARRLEHHRGRWGLGERGHAFGLVGRVQRQRVRPGAASALDRHRDGPGRYGEDRDGR